MPIMNPASVQGMDLKGVWLIFFGAAMFVTAIVYGLIAYSVIRWRARSHDGDYIPPQFHTNAPIEVTGVVIPLIIVIGLFYVTYIREGVVDFLRPAPYTVVDVQGFRWSWQFKYPGHHITITGAEHNPPTLVLPEGKTAQINLYSADVDHSFWVPAFLFKRDALPGIPNHFDITPDKLGVFHGECVEFCGLDHALMTFTVKVVPAVDYDRWIASGGAATV